MNATILYTISGCPLCQQARRHLSKLHIEYMELNVLEYPVYAADLKYLTGEVITPVLWMNEELWVEEDILCLSPDKLKNK